MEDAFSLGDCAGFLEHIGRLVLLALAQLTSIYVYSGARNDINIFLSALLVVAQEAYCGCCWGIKMEARLILQKTMSIIGFWNMIPLFLNFDL
ncbi:hypothetical protein JHK86_035232 [Glycine max]|nr:hypothetical protein JHK86_035232 [Glycine max]